MQCRAYSKNSKKQCQKPPIKGSKYCWYHQDKVPLLIALAIGLITGAFFYWLSDKKADVNAFCYPSGDNYCAMECLVENQGRERAEDTVLTFLYLLPKDTAFSAGQGYDISLSKYENIPSPYISEEVKDMPAPDQYNAGTIGNYKTFNIKIPNIPPKQSVKFTVYTKDEKNQSACRYLAKLMDAQEEVIKDMGLQLKNKSPDIYEDWIIRDFISAKKKRGNLYRPGYVHSENSVKRIAFLSEAENKAFSKITEQELGKTLSPGCDNSIDIAKTNNLPVISVESSEGDILLTLWPSYICFGIDLYKTKIFDLTVLREIYEGKRVFIRNNARFDLPVIQPGDYD